MKVLGVNGSTYIVEITHAEIEKVYDKTNYGARMDPLRAGTDFDIAAGYNFRSEILGAIRDMKDAYKSFSVASASMQKFIKFTKLGDEIES